MNLATHIEERLYTFGGPFAMFDDFTDKERDLSVLMMEQWGKFIKQQTVDWGQHPHHAYFDLNGLTEIENEAHSHRFAPNIAFQNLIIIIVRRYGWILSGNKMKGKIARVSYSALILDFKYNKINLFIKHVKLSLNNRPLKIGIQSFQMSFL